MIKKLIIEDENELAYLMDVDISIYEVVTVIAKYDDAQKIVKSLLKSDTATLKDVSLTCPDFNEYGDEYIITYDNQRDIYCEPMIRDRKRGYIGFDSDHIYIFDDCSLNTIGEHENSVITVLSYEKKVHNRKSWLI